MPLKVWLPEFPFVPINPLASEKPFYCWSQSASLSGGLAGLGPAAGWELDPGLPAAIHLEDLQWLNCGFRMSFGKDRQALWLQVSEQLWLASLPLESTPTLFAPGLKLETASGLQRLELPTGSLELRMERKDHALHLRLSYGEVELPEEEADLEALWDEALERRSHWNPELIPAGEEELRTRISMERLHAECVGPLPLKSLWLLLPALALFSPEEAAELFDRALQGEHTWPYAAQCLNAFPETLRSPERIARLKERLQPRLMPLLDDPQLPQWEEEADSLSPDIYDPSLRMVERGALLLAEAETLAELSQDPALFQQERKRLLSLLMEDHWSSERRIFLDHSGEGTPVRRMTFGTLLPLLSSALPNEQRRSLLRQLQPGATLFSSYGLQAWQPLENDSQPPLRSAEEQLLLLPLFHQGHGDALSPLYTAWQDTLRQQPILLSPGASALWLRCLPLRRNMSSDLGRYPAWVRFLERNRNTVVGAAAALILIIPAIIGFSFTRTASMSMRQQQDRIGFGNTLYELGRFEEAEQVYSELIDGAENESSMPAFLLRRGNARFRLERYQQALDDYQEAESMDADENFPEARWNQAQCLIQLGRNREALALLETYLEDFGPRLPGQERRIRNAIALLAQ